MNGKETLFNKLAALINVKSIITLILTCVFAYLASANKIDSKDFLTVFFMVISFYFGTQYEKNNGVK